MFSKYTSVKIFPILLVTTCNLNVLGKKLTPTASHHLFYRKTVFAQGCGWYVKFLWLSN